MEVPSALFPMAAVECLPAVRLGGRAPQALHMLKIVMNLFSHTSTDSSNGATWPGHQRLPTLAENLTRQKLSHTVGALAGGMVIESKGSFFHLLPSVWMRFLVQPHPSQEHLIISSAYSFIHTHTWRVSTAFYLECPMPYNLASSF